VQVIGAGTGAGAVDNPPPSRYEARAWPRRR
jgi:hypothetical protein